MYEPFSLLSKLVFLFFISCGMEKANLLRLRTLKEVLRETVLNKA